MTASAPPTTVPSGLELTWLLTSCALEPGLDGILLFDLGTDALRDVARAFVDLLAEATGARVRSAVLGSEDDEDALWMSLQARRVDGVATLLPADGPLVRGDDEGALVVVVPDLARLGLPASRAATAMLGSPVTSLQRHGRSRTWPPRTYWLAACRSAESGQVSPHLLDRFGARMPASGLGGQPEPLDAILGALDGDPPPHLDVSGPPRRWRAALGGTTRLPSTTEAAVATALRLHQNAEGMRRPLALLRLARATARLAGSDSVTAGHVEEAAVLTGLIAPTLRARPSERTRETSPDHGDSAGADRADTSPGARDVAAADGADIAVAEQVPGGAAPEHLVPRAADLATAAAYPEDSAAPDREATPLRLPWQRRAGRASDRGAVIGSRPAKGAHDIAWFDTVRQAATFRRFRGNGGRLPISPVDLRQYRRAPRPDHLLVLLLDHTCRRGWTWLPTLAPYLHEAYVTRASVCLVEVGGAGAPVPLRAEKAILRGVLDARLPAALARSPGSATPLAHGLEVARGALRHALQHGSAHVRAAQLVVVTDGLGNVPLSASIRGFVSEPVAGEGVADAITAADAVRELAGVRSVVVEPPAAPHPDVLLALASALSDDRALLPAERG